MKYAVLFRTHYWSDYLNGRFEEIKSMAPSADVFVCYDQTNGVPPDIRGCAPHSISTLGELGLFMPPEKALWYCGDYPFYAFYHDNPQYDFYLMIENDVLIKNVNIDEIVQNCLDTNADILGAHFVDVKDVKPGQAFFAGKKDYDQWRKCFFPMVGLKRSALVALFAQRLRQAEAKVIDGAFELPFCETFVGSEAAKQRWKSVELRTLAPLRTYGASKSMLYDKVISEFDAGIWHSVFPADRYVESRIRLEYRRYGKESFTTKDIVNDLRAVVRSAVGKVNKDLFAKRIEDFVIPRVAAY